MGRLPLPEGERERRVARLAPLFAYLLDHGIIALWVARRAGMRHGMPITRQRLQQMKRGACLTPEWFVEECCRVLGQPVEVVMGPRWPELPTSPDGEDGAGDGDAELAQRKAG